MKPTILLLGIGLGLTTGGCALPIVKSVPVDPVLTPGATQTPAPTRVESPQLQSKPVLYARDGSVVGEQAPGTIAVSEHPGQAVANPDGSRWTLLEPYQDTLTQNEGLQLEVAALNEALERANAREEELKRQLAEVNRELTDKAVRIAKLKDHNVELASRLTTAQIRRLQSEKLLLEAKLDWKRIETVINESETSSGEMGAEEALSPTDSTLGGAQPVQRP